MRSEEPWLKNTAHGYRNEYQTAHYFASKMERVPKGGAWKEEKVTMDRRTDVQTSFSFIQFYQYTQQEIKHNLYVLRSTPYA